MSSTTHSDIRIRGEQSGDLASVRHVNERAFGQPDEAALVDALRACGAVTLSLVAVDGPLVIGHILFSPVTIGAASGEPTTSGAAVGLAPMAVLPERQRTGIGSMLVRAGLERLRDAGHGAVVVLGHPGYYPRFGFVPASRFGLRCEFDCADEAFMAQELRPGYLAARRGDVVRFRPEFDAV